MTTLYDIIELQQALIKRDEIIDRQRNALQLLLNAIWIHINAPDDNSEQLQDAYRLVTSGNGEKIFSNLVKQEIMQRDAIIERQRIIIEQFMYGRDGAYEDAENTTTMTGASEQ